MSNAREKREVYERQNLSPHATLAAQSLGRAIPEEECEIRTCFQRDIDRITHSKSFRRLVHKTQVFLRPEGDHYRTRLTHTLEVARIARTISRALGLNEDLTEAIALGHDLGHTPFGHAGERALDKIMQNDGGFRHNEQSLRVVARVEKDGRGLNLTAEVRDGILWHTGDKQPDTPEGRVVRLSDRAAYVNHDADDAIRAGLLAPEDIPLRVREVLGGRVSVRINSIVVDTVNESDKAGEICMSPRVKLAFDEFYDFLNENLYTDGRAKSEETKVFGILDGIYGYYADNPEKLPEDYRAIASEDGLRRAVCDYVSGMTDKYAVDKFVELFVPQSWAVVN
ncbi:MAG: deoxyguanosinetriphosphate triphosphohydrolase [Oscillospiraceae bacterium]|jgi:dGTPase|nr:deoxyguanosinetriphosphate triphosphohydrolase [Oscillospiraceae bacterium]